MPSRIATLVAARARPAEEGTAPVPIASPVAIAAPAQPAAAVAKRLKDAHEAKRIVVEEIGERDFEIDRIETARQVANAALDRDERRRRALVAVREEWASGPHGELPPLSPEAAADLSVLEQDIPLRQRALETLDTSLAELRAQRARFADTLRGCDREIETAALEMIAERIRMRLGDRALIEAVQAFRLECTALMTVLNDHNWDYDKSGEFIYGVPTSRGGPNREALNKGRREWNEALTADHDEGRLEAAVSQCESEFRRLVAGEEK